MRAVLFGDCQQSMWCSLQYADSGGLTNLGGVGICATFGGKTIDVLW